MPGSLLDTLGVEEETGESWPPQWIVSYSDVATLLMTFFIVIATMISLKIPLLNLADFKTAPVVEQIVKIKELENLTLEQKNLIKQFRKLELKQLRDLDKMESVAELGNDIQQFIDEENLSGFLQLKVKTWEISIIPMTKFLFDPGKTRLSKKGMEMINTMEKFIKEQNVRIRVEGHTDNTPVQRGPFASNWELSVARANSVMRYIIEKFKFDPTRIEAIGYGASRPIVENDTPENQAKNRRVEFQIIREPPKTKVVTPT